MTLQDLKTLFRKYVKVVPGGPTTLTRGVGVLAALDALAADVTRSPNHAPGLLKSYRYLTRAEVAAGGNFGEAFEDLDFNTCCINTRIKVDFYQPAGQPMVFGQWLVAVWDATAYGKPERYVYVDGSFRPGDKTPAKFVPLESQEAQYGYVRRDTSPATITDWRVGELSIWALNGTDQFATAKQAGGVFPAFTGVEDAYWKPAGVPIQAAPFAIPGGTRGIVYDAATNTYSFDYQPLVFNPLGKGKRVNPNTGAYVAGSANANYYYFDTTVDPGVIYDLRSGTGDLENAAYFCDNKYLGPFYNLGLGTDSKYTYGEYSVSPLVPAGSTSNVIVLRASSQSTAAAQYVYATQLYNDSPLAARVTALENASPGTSTASATPLGPLTATGNSGETFPLPAGTKSVRGVQVLVASPGAGQYPVVGLVSSMYSLDTSTDPPRLTVLPPYTLSQDDILEGVALAVAGGGGGGGGTPQPTLKKPAYLVSGNSWGTLEYSNGDWRADLLNRLVALHRGKTSAQLAAVGLTQNDPELVYIGTDGALIAVSGQSTPQMDARDTSVADPLVTSDKAWFGISLNEPYNGTRSAAPSFTPQQAADNYNVYALHRKAAGIRKVIAFCGCGDLYDGPNYQQPPGGYAPVRDAIVTRMQALQTNGTANFDSLALCEPAFDLANPNHSPDRIHSLLFGYTQYHNPRIVYAVNEAVFGIAQPAAILDGTPAITSFDPQEGIEGGTFAVNGHNLNTVTKVTVGTRNASFTIVSESRLTFIVPSGVVNNTVTVENSSGVAQGEVSILHTDTVVRASDDAFETQGDGWTKHPTEENDGGNAFVEFKGAYAIVRFYGTKARITGYFGPNYGTVYMQVDSQSNSTRVNLNDGGPMRGNVDIWTFSGLTQGWHELQIVNAEGGYIVINAVISTT